MFFIFKLCSHEQLLLGVGMEMQVQSWCSAQGPKSLPRRLLRLADAKCSCPVGVVFEPGNCLVGSLRAATSVRHGFNMLTDLVATTAGEINAHVPQDSDDMVRLVFLADVNADTFAVDGRVILCHQTLELDSLMTILRLKMMSL